MPIVLATSAPTASGHSYDDVLGKQYEYPVRYRAMVAPGEVFVYYRGRRGSSDGRAVYFGTGIIGLARASTRNGQLVVDVHDVELFDMPVPAKSADGTYLETGTQRGTNWSSGVRRISSAVLGRILATQESQPRTTATASGRRAAFASPQHAAAVERYSVGVALRMLAEEFGEGPVKEMPAGNPGFDVLVERPGGDLHVEVKGTVLPSPVFHISEGQRRHAAARGEGFRLIVVYGVNLAAKTHRVATLAGPVAPPKADLQPEAWTGRVVL